MSARFYLAVLRESIIKDFIKKVSNSNDELCKLGAQTLANTLTKCPQKAKVAYVNSGFEWQKNVHHLSSTADGIRYILNGATHKLIPQTQFETFKSMSVQEKKQLLGRLNSEVKFATNLAQKEREREEEEIFRTGLAKGKAKAKETEEANNKEKEEHPVFFNQFIEGVIENIPPKSITDGVKAESWKNIAHKAALGLVADPSDLHFDDEAEDGSITLSFLGENEEHKFLVNEEGFTYIVNETKVSFKGYGEVLWALVKKDQ